MKARIALTCLLAGAAVGVLAMAASANNNTPGLAGAKVDNFMLIDQQGIGHQLYYYKSNPAVVIVSHRAGDKASAKTLEAVEKMRAAYEAKGVVFFALDSSGNAKKAPLGKLEKAKTIAVLDDDLQMVGRSLGVTSTAEVFVLNPKTWTVSYHGPEANLSAALDAVIAGQAPKVTEAKVNGTKLNLPDAGKAAEWKKISYEKEVAPILADKCVACHAPGGVAPFAMTSYEVVKGFAPMIREAVMSKRMPPFHSGKGTHDLKTDGRLTDAQTKTLVHWIEAGAPRGQGEDPLAKLGYVAPEWPYGKPDVVPGAADVRRAGERHRRLPAPQGEEPDQGNEIPAGGRVPSGRAAAGAPHSRRLESRRQVDDRDRAGKSTPADGGQAPSRPTILPTPATWCRPMASSFSRCTILQMEKR